MAIAAVAAIRNIRIVPFSVEVSPQIERKTMRIVQMRGDRLRRRVQTPAGRRWNCVI
jgi:hypothetical protein